MFVGAEAVLEPCNFVGFRALRKIRIAKKYRPRELDEKLRFERTRREARILGRAIRGKILCPHVFAVGRDFILIEKIESKTLNKISKIDKKNYFDAARNLAKLHSLDIIHGDYTPANLICGKKGLYVIDFGLGFISGSQEDKSVDLLTFVWSVGEEEASWFLDEYAKHGNKKIVDLMSKIENRGRYRRNR